MRRWLKKFFILLVTFVLGAAAFISLRPTDARLRCPRIQPGSSLDFNNFCVALCRW